MLGAQEVLFWIVVVIIASLLGRKLILKLYRDFKGLKKDIKKIDEEEEKQNV